MATRNSATTPWYRRTSKLQKKEILRLGRQFSDTYPFKLSGASFTAMGEFCLQLGMAGNSPGVGGAPEINQGGKAPAFSRG